MKFFGITQGSSKTRNPGLEAEIPSGFLSELNSPAAAGEAAAAFNADAVEGDAFDGFGVEVPLGLLDAGVEGGGGVVIVNGDGLLGDDGAGVDALIDEMNGAAGDFDAVIEGLFPCFESREGGEE